MDSQVEITFQSYLVKGIPGIGTCAFHSGTQRFSLHSLTYCGTINWMNPGCDHSTSSIYQKILCGKWLLFFLQVHGSSRSLRHHTAVPLSAGGQDVPSPPIIPNECAAHNNRPIEYFCETDNTPICSHCVIMGPHKDHAISAMEDKVRYRLLCKWGTEGVYSVVTLPSGVVK